MRAILRTAAAVAVLTLGCISSALAAGRIIIVNGNLPGVGFNDPTPAAPIGGNNGATLGEQRMNVFQRAANIWTQTLNPQVDVYVWARFVPLPPNVLGAAGPIRASRGFPGAEFPDLWYHEALANQQRGFDALPHDPTFEPNEEDLEPPADEISALFSTEINFYLGFDNKEESVPGTQDLLVVVLHELAHGLGFSNLIDETTGEQFLGFGDMFSQYTLDVTTNKNWNSMTDAERAASAVNIRKVSWSGFHVGNDNFRVLQLGEPSLHIHFPVGLGPFMVGTASFGPRITSTGVIGAVVLANDGVADPSTSNGCTPFVNSMAGLIALVDRGICDFTTKVKNAQAAGALAVLVADNVPGTPPDGLGGGADPTITIPSARITLADANTLKASLATGVFVTLQADPFVAGRDHVKGLVLLATFEPVRRGSAISHFDSIAFRNLHMEPSINPDLTSSVTVPQDLTTSLFKDLGWFKDDDGVPSGIDACPATDLRPSVIVGGCDSKAPNPLQPNGCSAADDVNFCVGLAGEVYLACVQSGTRPLVRKGLISQKDEENILQCARQTGGRP